VPTVSGNVGAVFNGGTITGATTLSPANKNDTALTIKPVAGATADGDLAINIDDDAGNQLFFIDAAGDGGLDMPSALGSFFAFARDGTTILEVGTSGGGHVTISPAGRTTFGETVILMTALPTADPHVVGQLYTVVGVLHVSAG
jgi:hypothetical protein